MPLCCEYSIPRNQGVGGWVTLAEKLDVAVIFLAPGEGQKKKPPRVDKRAFRAPFVRLAHLMLSTD